MLIIIGHVARLINLTSISKGPIGHGVFCPVFSKKGKILLSDAPGFKITRSFALWQVQTSKAIRGNKGFPYYIKISYHEVDLNLCRLQCCPQSPVRLCFSYASAECLGHRPSVFVSAMEGSRKKKKIKRRKSEQGDGQEQEFCSLAPLQHLTTVSGIPPGTGHHRFCASGQSNGAEFMSILDLLLPLGLARLLGFIRVPPKRFPLKTNTEYKFQKEKKANQAIARQQHT
ncbi:hypothetical protein LguiA_025555 [Lonicera macranthoides]